MSGRSGSTPHTSSGAGADADEVLIRLLFVDDGDYHEERIAVPGAALEGYERLIDALREEPSILRNVFIDLGRLCAAFREGEGG